MEIGEVSGAVLQIDFNYEEGSRGPELPVVRNLSLKNVTSKKSKYALNLRGFANAPIRDVRLEDCQFENVAEQNIVENVEGLVTRQVRMTRKGA
jgi:hypothetical protein